MTLILSEKIQSAIDFAIKTHELDQKQKRKGRDVPYIIHLLTVAFILGRTGASDELIIAGLLHDTVEDSHIDLKVLNEDIEKNFGGEIAKLVEAVTEKKNLPYFERKMEAFDRIKNFGNDEILLKSADVLANGSELVSNFKEMGEIIFKHFGGSKQDFTNRMIKVIDALLQKHPTSPLLADLQNLKVELGKIIA